MTIVGGWGSMAIVGGWGSMAIGGGWGSMAIVGGWGSMAILWVGGAPWLLIVLLIATRLPSRSTSTHMPHPHHYVLITKGVPVDLVSTYC